MTRWEQRVAGWVRRWRWLGVVLFVLIWLTWVASIVFAGLRWNPPGLDAPDFEVDLLQHVVSPDHLAFYSPARMIREGRARQLYDHEVIEKYQSGLFRPGRWEALEAYRNPPFYALMYVPTAGLPFRASVWIWNGIGVACLAGGVFLLRPARPWAAVLWTFTFLPVFTVLTYGQNSLLSVGVLCGTYRLLATRRPFLAGLLSGLLWFKPPLLLGLIVWALFDVRRLWPAAAGAVVTGAVLTGGSYLIVPEAWEGFVGTLGSNTRFDSFDWWKMHNPRAFCRLLAGPGRVEVVGWLVGAAAGLWCFWRVWRANRNNVGVVFGAAVLFTLWASPHSMIYEWSLAVVPAVLWWEHAPRARTGLIVVYAVAWLALLTATDVGEYQEWAQMKFLGRTREQAVVVQYSVPMIGWAGWRATRLLAAGVGSDGPSAAELTQPTQSVP